MKKVSTVNHEPSQPRPEAERYRLLAENVTDVIWTMDLNLRFTYISPSVWRLRGYSPEEALAQSLDQVLTRTSLEAALRAFENEMISERSAKAADRNPPVTLELEQYCKDGSTVWTEATMSFLRDPDGRPTGILGVTRDLTKRKEWERELQESEDRYRVLFDSVTDALLVHELNPDGSPGKCIQANQVACRKLGYSRSEILELTLLQIMPPEFPERLPALAERLFSDWQVQFEGPVLDRSGVKFDAETTLRLFDLRGRLVMLTNVRDITERKRADDAMRLAKESAEAASRAKSEFLANMSHELRTPLSGMLGMAELLLATDLGPEQRRYAQTIILSGKALLTIMNDLLDLSKIEAGKLAIQPGPLDLKQVVEDVLQMLSEKARGKGIELLVCYPPEVPRQLVGDAGRVRQVLTNLIDNAVKFTAEGKVVVYADCRSRTDIAADIRLVVEDTGIGIPEDRLEQIFDKFTQLEPPFTRKHGGVGLGLAISKQLIELMGGAVGVKSRVGEGSRFWFSLNLPLQTPESAGELASSRLTGNAGLGSLRSTGRSGRGTEEKGRTPNRVLVVEDNRVNQQVAVAILKKLGCRVDVAGSGELAVNMVEREPYDVIFMDCSMPGMDGFEATREIRRREKCNQWQSRIVAMTAHSSKEDRDRCLSAGMNDFIAKPITLDDFRAVLNRR